MTFSERMKELLDQGVATSKEFAARAGEKAQNWGEKGYLVSKDLATKAGAKAQEFGERGVLTLEIKQLESQAEKLVARLGTEVYRAFVEERRETLSVGDAPFAGTLTEIAEIRKNIEEKETELQSKKNSSNF
jgi:hypothetical protein